MAWIDDRIWCHPKVARLSDSAFRAWISSICYSSGFGTLGRLELEHQRVIHTPKKARSELLAAGFWHECENGAIAIHDWADHNDKRDAKRAADRERKRRQRERERELSRHVTRDVERDAPRDKRTLKSDRVTEGVPNGTPARTREPNVVWDALVEVFGEPSTDTARTLRGKVCSSLTRAGATPEEIIRRAKSWPNHFTDATLTETALEKHWDALGRKPLRVTR